MILALASHSFFKVSVHHLASCLYGVRISTSSSNRAVNSIFPTRICATPYDDQRVTGADKFKGRVEQPETHGDAAQMPSPRSS